MGGELMRRLTFISSATLILALDLILLVGAAMHAPEVRAPALFVLANIIHLGLVVSSPLLGLWYWREGPRWLGVVFWILGDLVDELTGVPRASPSLGQKVMERPLALDVVGMLLVRRQ